MLEQNTTNLNLPIVVEHSRLLTYTQLTLNSQTNTLSRNHKSDIGVPDNTVPLSAAAADREKCRTF